MLASTEPSIIAMWSAWSEWSSCNSSCTNKQNIPEYHFRTRECKIPPNGKQFFPIKNECFGSNKEIKKCDPVSCPKDIDRVVSSETEWSNWSECSVRCGIGTRSRLRKCSKAKMDFPCDGNELIMERSVCSSDCSNQVINKTYQWSVWSDWSSCSVSCGQGYSIRKRMCPGDSCVGPPHEIRFCASSIGCQMGSRLYARIDDTPPNKNDPNIECLSTGSCSNNFTGMKYFLNLKF